MRPGQNKRMRGRNNRKGPNPLTRSYESNGPDVKVRGTAQHVAEKYLQLARDAQSSGDPVMAESYLQHAEHYFRLIAAAMQAQQQQQMGYMRPPGENAEAEESEDDDDNDIPDRFASPFERNQPNFNQPQPNYQHQQPQPYTERPPHQMDRQPQMDRPMHQDRGPRPDRHERQERQERPEGGHQQRRDFRDHRQPRDRNFNHQRPAPVMNEPVGQDEPQPIAAALPAFITGGAPRIPVVAATEPSAGPSQPAANQPEAEQEAANFHLRNRRRRRPRAAEGGEAEAGGERPISGEVPVGE